MHHDEKLNSCMNFSSIKMKLCVQFPLLGIVSSFAQFLFSYASEHGTMAKVFDYVADENAFVAEAS